MMQSKLKDIDFLLIHLALTMVSQHANSCFFVGSRRCVYVMLSLFNNQCIQSKGYDSNLTLDTIPSMLLTLVVFLTFVDLKNEISPKLGTPPKLEALTVHKAIS